MRGFRGDGTSREQYRQGHVPGAVHLDWQRDLSWTDERGVGYLLLPPARFAAVMEAVGIGDRTRVVAYAETDHSGAARLWWALRYYGHDQVAVLNGGWTRWVAEGLPIETGMPHPAPATFTTRPRQQLLVLAREIEQALLGRMPACAWSIPVLLSSTPGRLSGRRMAACFCRPASPG